MISHAIPFDARLSAVPHDVHENSPFQRVRRSSRLAVAVVNISDVSPRKNEWTIKYFDLSYESVHLIDPPTSSRFETVVFAITNTRARKLVFSALLLSFHLCHQHRFDAQERCAAA